MWDSVPWLVGGGAQHSPEVARLLAYSATSGAEGIVTPGDLKVVPLATAGSSVRVLAGAGLIPNRYAGGAQQTYVARNVSEDVKPIAATGSGVGRNDLIVAEVRDPFMAGSPWPDPADVTVGPYVYTTVISNVSAAVVADNKSATDYLRANGYSAIPLAAVILPANTATITTGLIRDLRALARPRSLTRNYGGSPGLAEAALYNPSGTVATLPVTPAIEVPSWATHMDIVSTYSIQTIAGSSGAVYTQFGTLTGPVVNWNGTLNYLTAADLGKAVPTSMQGTTQTASTRVRVDAGQLAMIGWAVAVYSVAFYERAV